MTVSPATIAIELCKYSLVFCVCVFSYLSPTGGILASLVICIVILGLEPLVFGLVQKRVNFFSPHVLVPITYMLYALGPIAGYEWISNEIKRDYLVMFIAGMAALRLGLLLGVGKAIKKRIRSSSTPDWISVRDLY